MGLCFIISRTICVRFSKRKDTEIYIIFCVGKSYITADYVMNCYWENSTETLRRINICSEGLASFLLRCISIGI